MKPNTEIISSYSNNYFINKNESNSYPDVIDQVDKIINKYKNQLEQLKPKKVANKENINTHYCPSSDFSDKKMKNYSETLKIDSTQYINNNISNPIPNISSNLENNKNISKTENNKNEYNFEYDSHIFKPVNKKNNYAYDINVNYEMENDNIKLGSALTLEKTKVIQLLNLLKMKENEINNLKQKIEKFEEKITDIENKYQNIIYSLEQQQSIKLNDMYNNMSDEQNKIKYDFDEIKKNSEIQLEQINNELYNSRKIIKIFFDLFNKHIDLYNKTEILKGMNIITEYNFNEENAFLAAETIDKLINKLVQDNKDLFNELIRLKDEINNSNMIMEQNNNYIQQENASLRKLVHNLTNENNFLKNNNNNDNINKIQINNNKDFNDANNPQVVQSSCSHCITDRFNNEKDNISNRDMSPIEKLKIKINNLEEQIRSQTYY